MNYLLIHEGPIPKHIKYCIDQINKIDENSKVFLGINSNDYFGNVEKINLNEIISARTKEIIKLNIFSTENNRLWVTSLMRLFYISDVANHVKIDKFVHFDNDVLIFKKFDDIKEEFNYSKFNITPLSKNMLIFGYSFVPKLNIYDQILDKVYRYLTNQDPEKLVNIKSKELNEMKLLYLIYKENKEEFNLLNVLPNSSKYLFDPASYGQYLTGTKDKFSKKFIDENHLVGYAIKNEELLPYFNNNYPELFFKNKKFELINLHIHSKKLKKYKI